MLNQQILSSIRAQLIVSCQPVDNGPMDKLQIVAAMAQAAIIGGAAAVRIEGIDNLIATRDVIDVPIIGIVKRDLTDSPVRITPYISDIEALHVAGANIIAFDGTLRKRPTTIEAIVDKIHQLGRIAMADCSTIEDALFCHSLGVELIGTTLSGYTGGEIPQQPDLALLDALVVKGLLVIAEGRYNTPEQAAMALKHGAYAVTVGSALTRLEHIVSWFVTKIQQVQ